MTEAQTRDILHLTLAVLAVGSLIALALLGELREKTLRNSPPRDPGLGTPVYVAGVVLVGLYAGMMLLSGTTDAKLALLLAPLMPFVLMGAMIGPLLSRPDAMRDVGIIPQRPGRDLAWAGVAGPVGLVLAMAAGLAIDALLTRLDLAPPLVVHETLVKLQSEFSTELLLTVVIGAVILAPLFEEVIFRGILQTCLLHLLGGRRWLTLVIASAVFAVTHWWVVPWPGLVPLFVVGVVFGYVYERTGSLLTAILTHALFNAGNITIAVLSILASGAA